MPRRAYITPKLFRFFRELDQNNDREWFTAQRQRYHDEVRDPLLDLIEAFGSRLQKISPYLVADPRPLGGSLFRIYRDTRFARDKRPYKTHAGIHFRHVEAADVHAPGFYLHLEPGSVFAAAGMWRPDGEALLGIRRAMVTHPDRFKRAISRRGAKLDDGERLKRPPRGFDPEHPLVEDLKRKSFTASARFNQTQACAPDFLDRYARASQQAAPLMEFLARAVGLRW